MGAIKAVFGWVFRNALLFVLIVAALVAHSIWMQSSEGDPATRQESASEQQRLARAERTAREARAKLEAEAATASEMLAAYPETVRQASLPLSRWQVGGLY